MTTRFSTTTLSGCGDIAIWRSAMSEPSPATLIDAESSVLRVREDALNGAVGAVHAPDDKRFVRRSSGDGRNALVKETRLKIRGNRCRGARRIRRGRSSRLTRSMSHAPVISGNAAAAAIGQLRPSRAWRPTPTRASTLKRSHVIRRVAWSQDPPARRVAPAPTSRPTPPPAAERRSPRRSGRRSPRAR